MQIIFPVAWTEYGKMCYPFFSTSLYSFASLFLSERILHTLVLIWKTLSFGNRVAPRRLKPWVCFLEPKIFFLPSVTHLLAVQKIKPYSLKNYFPIKWINTLLLKLILFIVDHWGNAEKEICSHTNWTWGHIWEHRGTYSLASWSTGLTTDWFYCPCLEGLALPGWAGLFLSTATADQGNGSLVTSGSASCLVGIGFAFVDCIPVLLGMNIGIYIPMELQLPTHIIGPDTTTTVSLSSSAFQFPLGPPPLAVTPTSSVNELAFPFP